jgi:hypothetical protein
MTDSTAIINKKKIDSAADNSPLSLHAKVEQYSLCDTLTLKPAKGQH